MIAWLASLYQSFVVTLLWLSVVAALVALIVMVVRRLLKGRIPHRTLCVLWLLVFLRLFLPVTIETPFSLIPSPITNAVQQNFVTEELSSEPAAEPDDTPTAVIPETPQASSAPVVSEPVVDYPQTPTVSAPVTQAPQQSAPVLQPSSPVVTDEVTQEDPVETPVLTKAQQKAQLRQAIAAGIWLFGVVAMLVSGVISYLMLRRRVYDSIRTADGVWEHPELSSPFILGLFRPRIYLPMGIDGQARQFILQHEQAHLHRRDHIVKPICWLALAFHWFNPFVWGAFQLMGRDIENACDERVIHTLGNEVKADYAATLLALATKKRFPAPSPLSFDEGDAEARIKNVLRFKKPVLWVSIAAVVVVAITAVCLLSNRSPRSLGSFYPQVNWEKIESVKAGFDLTDLGAYDWQVELSDEATAEVIDLLHEYKYWKGLSHLVPDNRIGWLHSVWRLYFEFENGSELILKYTEDGVLVVHYSSGLLPDGSVLESSNIHYSVDGGEKLASAMLALIQQEEKEVYTENLRAAMKDTDIYSEEFPALLAQLMPPNVEFSPDDPLTADDYAAIFAQAEWLSGQDLRLDRSRGAAYVHTYHMRLLLSEFLVGGDSIDWDGYTGQRHMNVPNDIVEVLLEQTNQREFLQSSAVENITPYSDAELAVLMDKLGLSYKNAEAYDITVLFSYSGYDPVRCTYCILFHDDTFKIVSASCEREGLDEDPADDPVDNPAPISELGELFLAALNDKVEIVDPGLGMTDTLSELVKATVPTVEMEITEIAAVDLDGDGIEEVLLLLETPGTVHGTMILRCSGADGQIYAYELWARAFNDVKTDGTFSYSGGASVNGIARISFTPEGYEKEYITYSEEDYPERNIYYYVNKQPATEQEFLNTFAAWRDQPGVTWVEYTPENALSLLRENSVTGEPETFTELSRFFADLTHDGVNETITLSYHEEWRHYTLTVSNSAGEIIWTGEANLAHAGWNGLYLYQKDNRNYLMRWLPGGSTGGFNYYYQIFSLAEDGTELLLAENNFRFDAMSVETVLSIDVDGMRAFEKEVNALLENTIVLITTDEGTPYYSTQDVTLCRLWAAPVSEVQEWKQNAIDRLPIVMAYMELEPALLASVEEQVAIHMGDHDLAYVEQVKEIGRSTYRITFKPGDYDGVSRVTWQDSRYFDIVMDGNGGYASVEKTEFLAGLSTEIVTSDTLPADPEEYYLVAEVPEEDIRLYARNSGSEVLVVKGALWKVYDRCTHVEELVLPEVWYKSGSQWETDALYTISQIRNDRTHYVEELACYQFYVGELSKWADDAYDWCFKAEDFNRNNTVVYNAESNTFAMTYKGRTYYTQPVGDFPASVNLPDGFSGVALITGHYVDYELEYTEYGAPVVCVTVKAALGFSSEGDFDENRIWQSPDGYYEQSVGQIGITIVFYPSMQMGGFYYSEVHLKAGYEFPGLATTDRSEPLWQDVVQNRIDAGFGDFYLIREDGTLVMWGNPDGVLEGSYIGDNHTVDDPLVLLEHVVYVDANGEGSVYAIDDNETLWGMGSEASPDAPNTPLRIAENVAKVECGQYGDMFLMRDGTLWDNSGMLPALAKKTINGTTYSKVADNIVDMSYEGFGSGAAVTADGELWVWLYPDVPPQKLADDAARVYGYRMFVTTEGELKTWSYNYNERAYSVSKALLTDVEYAVGSFFDSSYAIRTDGTLWEISDSGVKDIMGGVIGIACGEWATIVLKSDGTLWHISEDGKISDYFLWSKLTGEE